MIGIALTVSSLAGTTARAEERTSNPLTSAQLALVRTNCSTAQTSLDRIRKNDTLSRVYLGQEYETISYNFMAPMNNRVAATRLDGTKLTKTTASFGERLDNFHSTYLQYTQTMNDLITMKCADHPQEFYDKTITAYNGRVALKKAIDELRVLAGQYQQQVLDLKPQLGLNEEGHK